MAFLTGKGSAEALRAAGSLSTVGLAFVLALAIGFWFGSVLDRWAGTRPLFTIVCFFFGLAAGILNVYRIVSRAFPAGRPAPGAPAPPADPGPSDRDLHADDD
ncbi:MAG TPA: AtpZ/AtpI family protein [Vicinamibacterales bacterium]|nr:AtpZ/AtpI family protein [Vicinamibacterales bacterium]HOG28069.1 AtpZ/AtpI family protein [Vicinamibacterales bacterium]HOQ61964.1 AtpZ/AtpI family protein [Vicinamibacterales bacterium]HPW20153.1 AtpZ/AtpI family protein [Vicinamibacterales bacterium]